MKHVYYPLDLSALAYPMMRSKTTQSNFRFSATLDREVDPEALTLALRDVLPLYPNFKSKIVCGFFWHKLKASLDPVPVKEDDAPPLSPLKKKDTNGYPFRVAYKGREIVLEVFHAITDGNVGAFFLSDLLTRYAEISRKVSDKKNLSRDLIMTDAFMQYGQKKSLRAISLKNYNGKSVIALGKAGNYASVPRLISEEIDLPNLKRKAKEAGATITEYIAACYVAAILEDYSAPLKKPLSLFVPVNLRRFFPSNTIQNFVCFERINVEKNASDLSFPALLETVKTQFRSKITKEGMQNKVDDIKKCFRLPIVKLIPLFIKRPVFKLVKKIIDKVRQTAILSNVGVIELSPEATAIVKDVRFFLNISRNTPLNVAVVSYQGRCRVDMTCGLKETVIPERFFRNLSR